LSKLKAYKLYNNIIKWIKNFLTDRKQRVRVNGKFSCWAKVLNGIPQGSILGLLLFIIFRNDLVDVCEENIKMYLFADDAKMYCHIENVADKDKLQIRIEKYFLKVLFCSLDKQMASFIKYREMENFLSTS